METKNEWGQKKVKRARFFNYITEERNMNKDWRKVDKR